MGSIGKGIRLHKAGCAVCKTFHDRMHTLIYTQRAILQEALVIHRFLDTFCRPGAASDSQSRIRLPA